MLTLGINAAFHDSAACILKDGQLLAAAEEERFTHIKHGKRPIPFSAYEMPFHSISYCLDIAGAHINDIDHFAYSFDPSLAKGPEHPAFMDANINARLHLRDGWPHHLQKKFMGADIPENKWHFVEHHIAHAASAFHASPYPEAAVLTIDGRGENATTSYFHGKGNDLKTLRQVYLPHSLGLLYEKMTTYLGFLHSSDEYKVMALASYGEPVYAHTFRSMIRINGTGDYTISDDNFEKHFGPARKKDDPFTQFHFNIAHSLQVVLEESALKLANWLHKETGSDNLCMAGGVALNCVMNARLRDHGPFKNIWVQPAAGDSGTALGAALWLDAKKRSANGQRSFVMDHAYWGPGYTDEQIEKFLRWTKTPYRKLENVAVETAAILAQDKIIGWFQGRMEFGPRALGSRSILASPINPDMQARLNEVKDREDFRPVAPVVLEEDAPDWFENAHYSPFMLFIYDVKPDKAGRIPAVRHVDGTARIQTVNRNQHPKYYDLLTEFKKLTGVPILVNTSFNTLGKPIVCTPRDAIECFWGSPFDSLVIGSFLIEKR
jgi:carbamoyltransferase